MTAPIPWEAFRQYFGLSYIVDASGGAVATDIPHDVAAFIVSSVNGHGTLIRLLSEARITLEMWKDVAPAVSLCRDIDIALAKAKGTNDAPA